MVAWTPPAVSERASLSRTITAEDVERFAQSTGDRNPLHFDPGFAAATRFGRLVVQGGSPPGSSTRSSRCTVRGPAACSCVRSRSPR